MGLSGRLGFERSAPGCRASDGYDRDLLSPRVTNAPSSRAALGYIVFGSVGQCTSGAPVARRLRGVGRGRRPDCVGLGQGQLLPSGCQGDGSEVAAERRAER